MNAPPTDGIRVAVTDLEELVADIFKAVPLPEDRAQLIAGKLVECDLRVLQVNGYVRSFPNGTVNPNPHIRALKEGPTAAALSGDSLGYLVATKGMEMAIAKAPARPPPPTGSVGNYARMAMRADLRSQCLRSLPSRRDDPGLHPGQPTFGLRHAGRSGQTDLLARFRQPLRDRRRDLPEVPTGFHQGHRHCTHGQYPIGYAGGRC